MDRRRVLRSIGIGAAGATAARASWAFGGAPTQAERPAAARGLPPVKITDIKAILTAPDRIRLVVVKVADQRAGSVRPGLRHLHPAARYVVQTAVEQYLRPFLIGRNPDEIEDIWQSAYVSSYWRNGPRPLQRHERGRRGALGHQGEARRHAPLPAPGRQGAQGRRLSTTTRAGATSPRSRTGRGTAWSEASATSASRWRCRASRPTARRGGPRAREGVADGPTSPARVVGVRALRAAPAQALRAHARERSAKRSSCSTTSTSASPCRRRSRSARSWSSTARSSSRTRSRPSRTSTSACCASRRACPSPWASCSTPSTSTCP